MTLLPLQFQQTVSFSLVFDQIYGNNFTTITFGKILVGLGAFGCVDPASWVFLYVMRVSLTEIFFKIRFLCRSSNF